MSMHTLKTRMVKEFKHQMNGPAKPTEPVVPEKHVDKALRVARTALDKTERAVHEAKNAKTFKAAKKKMDLAQKHMNTAYRAHEKAGG